MRSKEIKNAKRDAEMLNNVVPESILRDHLDILHPGVDPKEVLPENTSHMTFI